AAGAVALLSVGGLRAAAQPQPVGATADVRDASGRSIAAAQFREGRAEVLIALTIPTPPPLSGTHALRIHEIGRCDPPDFVTAGREFNPSGRLPNIDFDAGQTPFNMAAVGASLGPGPA